MANDDEPTVVDLTEARERAEQEQLEQMHAQAQQQAARQLQDNAAAERLRTFGDAPLPRTKAAREDYLRGAETISGPTGPTSSLFEASAPLPPTTEEAPSGSQD